MPTSSFCVEFFKRTCRKNGEKLSLAHVAASVSFLSCLLLGRTPFRRLSQSLIVILMLISPLSFSTDKVPNFAYECPVSTGCAIKTRRTVAVNQRSDGIIPRELSSSAKRHGLPAPITPSIELICSDSPSRSPPV